MLISWHILSSISLFIISALTTRIISKMYLFCLLFFVSHSTFSIIIFECISLLILISAFTLFFSMFLNISSILISCITTLKLTSCRLMFNEISLIQKLFFFNILLLSFILTQNINKFDHLFIVSMFLRVNSILLMSISLAHLTMFSVIIIMIFLIFSFSLMKILILNFLQWFYTDDATLMLRTRWFSNNVVDFLFALFAQLSTHFFFFANFFSSLLIIFFNLFNWFFMHWLTVNATTRWRVSFSIIFVNLFIFFQSISSLFLHSLSLSKICCIRCMQHT